MANVISSNNSALVLAPPLPGGTNSAVTEELQLKDIKDPVPIGSFPWWLTAIALAVAAFAVWQFLKKRQKPVSPSAIFIPPHRRAKERLRGATELISDPYRFCSLVSDVTRVYLEERFDLHAPDRTTDEFLAELCERSTLKEEHKMLLEDFLTRCDLVKFARHEPTEPELRALLDAALRLVDETQEVVSPSAAEVAKP